MASIKKSFPEISIGKLLIQSDSTTGNLNYILKDCLINYLIKLCYLIHKLLVEPEPLWQFKYY